MNNAIGAIASANARCESCSCKYVTNQWEVDKSLFVGINGLLLWVILGKWQFLLLIFLALWWYITFGKYKEHKCKHKPSYQNVKEESL